MLLNWGRSDQQRPAPGSVSACIAIYGYRKKMDQNLWDCWKCPYLPILFQNFYNLGTQFTFWGEKMERGVTVTVCIPGN